VTTTSSRPGVSLEEAEDVAEGAAAAEPPAQMKMAPAPAAINRMNIPILLKLTVNHVARIMGDARYSVKCRLCNS
jgi:hypothetical protein